MVYLLYVFVCLVLFFWLIALYKALRDGVFISWYGKSMTVRKSDGRFGFYFVIFLNFSMIFLVVYFLYERFFLMRLLNFEKLIYLLF